jgi:hypothetical protein
MRSVVSMAFVRATDKHRWAQMEKGKCVTEGGYAWNVSPARESIVRAKAVSPLRSATEVHDPGGLAERVEGGVSLHF